MSCSCLTSRVIYHSDLGEDLSHKQTLELFKKFDKDGSGVVDFKEFVLGVADFVDKSESIQRIMNNSE